MINAMTRTYNAVGDDINMLEVEIHYEKGGYNPFFNKPQQRGYYFYVHPYRLEEHDGYSVKCISFSPTGGAGFKVCILPCERQSKKRFETACSMIDECIAAWLPSWLAENDVTISDEYTVSTRERQVI